MLRFLLASAGLLVALRVLLAFLLNRLIVRLIRLVLVSHLRSSLSNPRIERSSCASGSGETDINDLRALDGEQVASDSGRLDGGPSHLMRLKDQLPGMRSVVGAFFTIQTQTSHGSSVPPVNAHDGARTTGAATGFEA